MHNLQQERTIYQFASIASLKSILEYGTLKFTRPYDFNDPFDCDIDLVDYEFGGILSETVQDAIGEIKKQYPNPHSPLLDPTSDLCILKSLFRDRIRERADRCRICCFSLVNAPVLMWSHYANKHGGVCIEFNNHAVPRFPLLNEDKEVSEGIVSYNANKRINFFTTEIKTALAKIFLSKSDSWSYEKEFRIILVNNDKKFHQFSPEFITSIYFGLKVSKDDKDSIIDLSKRKFNHLQFYDCSKSSLNLVFNQIF